MNTPKTKQWIREFQSLLHKIGQNLTSDDVESLKFLLKPDISQGKLEKVQNVTGIFTLMQESEILSFQNTKRLASLLEEINRSDQASKLKEFEKALHQSKSVPYNIKKERLVRHFKKTDDLVRLENLMKEYPVVTISGPLGAGKSQTALAFGTDLQKNNQNCIVWLCNAKDKSSLLTSLRSLADELSIETLLPQWSDTDDENTISLIGKELQDHLQERDIKPYYNLIILDDVNSESTNSVKNLVQGILTTEEPNIKFLVTTRNEQLLKEYGKIYLKGFTQDESLDFLTKGVQIDEERKSQYRKLAEGMGNLPLALYTARTYMENMLIGPRNFLELLKAENIEGIESQLEEMDIQEKKLFTAMKFCIYQDLKENLKPKVFEMFQMTQFLENEDIPICLLEFVYRDNGYNENSETMMLSNFLVQALQKRSLGTIEGEDENRRLSVHSSILLTLGLCTTKEEKHILLKKLLWGFSLLFDKDVFMKTDLLRMKQLIPHARAFLRHAEKMNLHVVADYDMLILMTFVYDVVGYGYNFGHFRTISNKYSEKCKENCFRIIGCNEEEIDDSLEKEFDGCDKNSVEFYEALAKKKCDVLWTKLEDMARIHSGVFQELVPRFVLQKFRTQLNIQDLSRHLNIEPSDFIINAARYEILVEKGLALPFDCMTSYFIHELVLAAFYTYGRQLFYQRQKADCKEARRLLSYLFIAKEIGEKLSEKQKMLPPLNSLLSNITGVLQARVEDDAQLYTNKMEVLQQTAESADALSKLDVRYHIFGIFKMDTSISNHFQNNCLKLAIRCFTTILKLNIDDKTKLEVYQKGCKLADEILTRVKLLGDRRDIPGYKVRVAEFYISIENIPSEHLNRAEKLFQDVFPKDVLDEDCKRKTLERHELQAGQGLVKCYELSKRQKEADNLKSKLNAFEF